MLVCNVPGSSTIGLILRLSCKAPRRLPRAARGAHHITVPRWQSTIELSCSSNTRSSRTHNSHAQRLSSDKMSAHCRFHTCAAVWVGEEQFDVLNFISVPPIGSDVS